MADLPTNTLLVFDIDELEETITVPDEAMVLVKAPGAARPQKARASLVRTDGVGFEEAIAQAQAAAADAETAAGSASTQAGAAAGFSTAASGYATAAGIASAAAAEAEAEAVFRAQQAAAAAADANDAAQLALAERVYADTTAGVAGVGDGEFFYTVSPEDTEVYIVWRRSGSTAIDTGKRVVSASAVAEVSAKVVRGGLAGPPGDFAVSKIVDPLGRVVVAFDSHGFPLSMTAGKPNVADAVDQAVLAYAGTSKPGLSGPPGDWAVSKAVDPQGRVLWANDEYGTPIPIKAVANDDYYDPLPPARAADGALIVTNDNGTETTIAPPAGSAIQTVAESWAPRARGGKGRAVYKGRTLWRGQNMPAVFNRDLSLLMPSVRKTLYFLAGTGQSNMATNTNGDSLILTTPEFPGRIWMPYVNGAGDVRGRVNTQGDDDPSNHLDVEHFTAFVDLVATAGVHANTGQSVLESLCNQLVRAGDETLGAPLQVFAFVGATGGASISILGEGSPAFENIIKAAARARDLLPSDWRVVVLPMPTCYGETDQDKTPALMKSLYEATRQRYDARFRAVLGNDIAPTRMLHIAPYSTFSYEGGGSNQAMWELSTEAATKAFHMVIGGANNVPYSLSDADGLHRNNRGNYYLGEYAARWILQNEFSAQPWEAFGVHSIRRLTTDVLALRLAPPVGSLQLNAGRLGFQQTLYGEDMPSPYGTQGELLRGFHFAQPGPSATPANPVEVGYLPADPDGVIRELYLRYTGALAAATVNGVTLYPKLGHAMYGYAGLQPGTINPGSPGDPNADPPVPPTPPNPPVVGRVSNLRMPRPAYSDSDARVSRHDGFALPNWPVPQWISLEPVM